MRQDVIALATYRALLRLIPESDRGDLPDFPDMDDEWLSDWSDLLSYDTQVRMKDREDREREARKRTAK